MAYDILIKSGLLLDGLGNTPVLTDIGIKDGLIADIGSLNNESAQTLIQANQKYVAPGFIDITNHSDTYLTLFKYPNQESMLAQGVTTIVGGNCGASLAPLASPDALSGIQKWADLSEINMNWNTVGEFLSEVDRLRPAVNFCTLLGYGTLRRNVIGNDARLLNFEEREKIKYLIREGIKEGAFGVSLGLAYGHERISPTEEIIEICRAAGEAGGIIALHLRSEGSDILASVNEAVRIGRETQTSVHISHLKTIGKKSWHALPNILDMIEHARSSGLHISFDVYPYATTGSLLYLLIPGFMRQDGFRELFSRIDDPQEKKKIVEALKSSTLHYEKIIITSAKVKNIVGKSVAEIAEEAGITPEEALIDTVRANEGRVSIIGRTISLKNTERAMRDKNSFIASDGAGYAQEEAMRGNLVHPRSFGAFPHFWHRFVTDTHAFTPQEAIKKMTSGPAEKLGVPRRGSIKKNNAADIVVFDPRLMHDRATYRNPFRYPSGVDWVIVNGKVAIENRRILGVRSGRALKRNVQG